MILYMVKLLNVTSVSVPKKFEGVDFIFFYVKTIRLCLELYLMNHVMSAWKITIRK